MMPTIRVPRHRRSHVDVAGAVEIHYNGPLQIDVGP